MEWISSSESETRRAGGQIGAELESTPPGYAVVLLVQGEMGAGKTQLIKGIAEQLGIAREIVSPTYTYVRNYAIPKREGSELIHIDGWRLPEDADLSEIGFEAFLRPGNIIVVEWPRALAKKLEDIPKASSVFVANISERGEQRYITFSRQE